VSIDGIRKDRSYVICRYLSQSVTAYTGTGKSCSRPQGHRLHRPRRLAASISKTTSPSGFRPNLLLTVICLMSSRGPPGHPAPTRGTTQPPPPGFGELSFVKHIKNIGRAYRKQATVLVACYRERIPASRGSDYRSNELRK
jgi:hypothetical protein